jgi:hypothetical protein
LTYVLIRNLRPSLIGQVAEVKTIMDEKRKTLFDQLEVVGYLPEMRKLVMGMATPFWWFGIDEKGRLRVFHNGTLTVFRSGVRQIGVTADHVYEQYLIDKGRLESFGPGECRTHE